MDRVRDGKLDWGALVLGWAFVWVYSTHAQCSSHWWLHSAHAHCRSQRSLSISRMRRIAIGHVTSRTCPDSVLRLSSNHQNSLDTVRFRACLVPRRLPGLCSYEGKVALANSVYLPRGAPPIRLQWRAVAMVSWTRSTRQW